MYNNYLQWDNVVIENGKFYYRARFPNAEIIVKNDFFLIHASAISCFFFNDQLSYAAAVMNG